MDAIALPRIREIATLKRSTNDMLRTALTDCLKHYDVLATEARNFEVQLIETRATVQALNIKIKDDAETMRKLVREANSARNARHVDHRFSLAELREATDEYLRVHSRPGHEVRSVSRDRLVEWLRAGKPAPQFAE